MSPAPHHGQTVIARTKSLGSYPSTDGVFFACESQDILDGPDPETPEFRGRGDTFFALCLPGCTPPDEGAFVACTFVPDRWVFQN